MGKTTSLIIGISFIFIIAIINNNFAEFLFASIVCTFGLTLIIWLPVAYVIGYIILIIFNFPEIGVWKEENDERDETEPSKEVLAIVKYIILARINKSNNMQITAILKDKSWPEEKIREAFRIVDKKHV